MNSQLTKIQKQVLEFLKKEVKESGRSPSYKAIATHLGYNPPENNINAARKHVLALEKKGYIDKEKGTGKTKIIENKSEELIIEVPLVGATSAGSATQIAEPNVEAEVLQIDRRLFERFPDDKKLIALRIEGDSMNNHVVNGVKLRDGNFVVVEYTTTIQTGDVVLAIIDNCATIKVFSKDRNQIILLPNSQENSFLPIYLDKFSDFLVQGKVIAALENPSLREILNKR